MPRGATARLFVAVDPPPAVCDELTAWAREATMDLDVRARRRGARAIRLLAADTMHITLCFLGSRPIEEIDVLLDALQASAPAPGELSLGAPVWLPPRDPRNLAVAVHDSDGGLARLHEALADTLSGAIAWQPERRRFRAHVTVARIGRSTRARSFKDAGEQLPATPARSFSPDSIVLYRSWLAPTGASYEALARLTLLPVESNSSPSPEGGSALGAGAGQTSPRPLERVGVDSSGHSGSEPSSQE